MMATRIDDGHDCIAVPRSPRAMGSGRQRPGSGARGFMRVACNRLCTPDMGMSLWGESPLWEGVVSHSIL